MAGYGRGCAEPFRFSIGALLWLRIEPSGDRGFMGALELWEIVLIAGAVGLVAIVLLGRRLRRWVVGLPGVAVSVVLMVATGVFVNIVTGVNNSVNDDKAEVEIAEAIQGQLVLGVLALALVVLALFNTIARERQRKSLRDQHQQELDEVRTVNRQEWSEFVGYELEHLLFEIGKILSQPDSAKRSERIGHTKEHAVWAASRYVGRLETQVRACLYRHDETAKILSPTPGLSRGGKRACTRQFGEDDPTYRSIVNDRKPVVMPGISDEEVERDHLDYRGFIAYPIQVQGRDTVLGALVVDSAGPDDLDDMVDVGKVRILAALLSAPLFVQKQASAR